MSKKLASGLNALVLDVKTGDGAFMKDYKLAKQLAQTMISIGKNMNRTVMALITNMNQPLGHACGNSIEIEESIDILKGKGPADVRELVIEQAAYMIKLGKLTDSLEKGRKLAEEVI